MLKAELWQSGSATNLYSGGYCGTLAALFAGIVRFGCCSWFKINFVSPLALIPTCLTDWLACLLACPSTVYRTHCWRKLFSITPHTWKQRSSHSVTSPARSVINAAIIFWRDASFPNLAIQIYASRVVFSPSRFSDYCLLICCATGVWARNESIENARSSLIKRLSQSYVGMLFSNVVGSIVV